MTEEIKKETVEQQANTKKIFARSAGIYDYQDGAKISHFIFPLQNTLEDNLAVLSHIQSEILTAINSKLALEKKKVEEKIVQEVDKKSEKVDKIKE